MYTSLINKDMSIKRVIQCLSWFDYTHWGFPHCLLPCWVFNVL